MPAVANYARHRSHAARLLERWGGPATITRETTEGGGEPDYPGGPTTPSSTVATIHHITLLETGGRDGEDRDLVQSSEFVGLLACAEDFVPSSADTMRVDGRTYSLAEVTPVQPAPGGRTLVYEVLANA